MRAFLDVCEDPAVIRISHLDAPAVLGWAEWREVDAQHWLGVSRWRCRRRWTTGVLRRRERAAARAHADGRDGRGSMMIANAADPAAARAEVEGPLLALLEGLRA